LTLSPRRSRRKNPEAVYYPLDLLQQTAYRHYLIAGHRLPVSELLVPRGHQPADAPLRDDATQACIVRALS
jgi:hypothetical protein